MKSLATLALAFALPLPAATIAVSPAAPKAGDAVVVTAHDLGGFCPLVNVTAQLVGQTLQVDVVPTPTGCLALCPAIIFPIARTSPPVVLPEAKPYTIEYAVTNCSGMRNVVATKQILVRPSCAFDTSLTVARTTSTPLIFSWCDASYSPFPDTGQFVTAYRIFVVKEGQEPMLVQEQTAGTTATVALSNREAGARGAFVEAELCDVTIAGCHGSSTIKSNVVALDVAPNDTCSFGGAALCLGGRFSVTARFHTAAGSSPAHPVPITKDSGYFWFFGPDNAEVVAKIVDACSLSQNFWFFAGGMTDVGVDLVVLDTKTGAVRRYSSPPGAAFAPIQDTNAFAGCN